MHVAHLDVEDKPDGSCGISGHSRGMETEDWFLLMVVSCRPVAVVSMLHGCFDVNSGRAACSDV